MAHMERHHLLDGFGGQLGQHLRLENTALGKMRLDLSTPAAFEGVAEEWNELKAAVDYARAAQHRDEYQVAARVAGLTPLQVATFDFLHPPEILEIDLDGYLGRPGDAVRIRAIDDTRVARVGIIILDESNHLVEMGLATRVDEENWRYSATHQAPGHHVRVVVDASDLPGNLSEARADKQV